jgi:hypothetical protein
MALAESGRTDGFHKSGREKSVTLRKFGTYEREEHSTLALVMLITDVFILC